MSGVLALAGVATTFGVPALSASGLLPAWIRQGRKIGSIIPDVTIEEQHQDRLQVTQHPIADGTPISDHAFRMPSTLTMRCGWSNANLAGTITSAIMSGTNPWGGFTETRAREIYEKLRELQGVPAGDGQDAKPVQLIDISTGKRDYKDMILTELAVSTDHTKEYSLFVEAHFQQVFRVKTKSTTQPATHEMAKPEATAETTDGTAQQPVDRSDLSYKTGRQAPTNPNPVPDKKPPPPAAPKAHPLRWMAHA